jgi:hypothetical protein
MGLSLELAGGIAKPVGTGMSCRPVSSMLCMKSSTAPFSGATLAVIDVLEVTDSSMEVFLRASCTHHIDGH